ncbi:parvalbumin beta-like isoform X1 [Dendrobates tinctorius]|uniref:parvalbumin beta-like isoform X1 n=1 Tax=Dendrobates tinctorius TaxID=92724 RepID=UPI003CC939D3
MASIRDFLSKEAIDKALSAVKDSDSFLPIEFFNAIGLKKQVGIVNKIFNFLDRNKSGFIEEEDAEDLLQNFRHDARKLTPAETAAFMKAGDPNNTGKISPAAFSAMVQASD